MEILNGLVIQPGIALGKAHIWISSEEHPFYFDLQVNQKELLEQSLKKSTVDLEETISSAQILYPDSVALVFEAHKLMVNDPLLLEDAFRLIAEGKSAYEAYRQAAKTIIAQFETIDNTYMRNRIVDIEDATDRVLSSISDKEYEHALRFSEPRILIIPKMKPSILVNCHPDSIAGFVSAEGAYDQHSGNIARTKTLPGMVSFDITKKVRQDDLVLLDANRGKIFINPTPALIREISREKLVKP
ncbi:MAG TPA: phosphoenolpyruvate-utilizing N-terminal domain-containing protein [Bacillota bacterium]|nr:phosphoenolpyruvate-utilizing N-terminal domain-containing protein [Bacillota bacterium]